MHPLKLLVYVLLWEYKHIEFFWLNKVWTLSQLLYEFTQQVTPLLQEFTCGIAKWLLLGKSWNVQTRKSFNETISESKEVFISSFDLECLLSGWVDAIDYIYKVIIILLVGHYLEVSGYLITL